MKLQKTLLPSWPDNRATPFKLMKIPKQTLPPISESLQQVRRKINAAAATAGRPATDIKLVAVSKYMPVEYLTAALDAHQLCFGENTLQDALTKIPLLEERAPEWHFIGHLQSNKAKLVPGNFSWLHTLHSMKLANKLSQQTRVTDSSLNTLVQVNIADDPDKKGLRQSEVLKFIDTLLSAQLAGLKLRGLMTIGSAGITDSERRREFSRLRELNTTCADRFGSNLFSELSMGMSDDYPLAIEEGATIVRVGSAIFGPRPIK